MHDHENFIKEIYYVLLYMYIIIQIITSYFHTIVDDYDLVSTITFQSHSLIMTVNKMYDMH